MNSDLSIPSLSGCGGPLVSILMCAWNSEKYVGESVCSILAQTYPRFELIVVDDGSSDATAERVAAFEDPRVRLYRNPHSGLAASRNAAREKARGEFLVIVDSDDLIHPSLIEKEIALFVKSSLKDFVVYPDLALMGENGERSGVVWKYRDYTREEILPLLFQAGKNIVPEASMMIPKVLSDAVGEYNTHVRDSDNEYIARLAKHASLFLSLKEPLYSYRRYEGNMSGGSRLERAKSSVAMIETMVSLFEKHEIFPQIPWKELPDKVKESEWNLRLAEVLWRHTLSYLKEDAHEVYLNKLLPVIRSALSADPERKEARELAGEILSVFPHLATDMADAGTVYCSAMPARAERPSVKRSNPLKILYLADCRSQHTKRFASFFRDRGHEVHLFDRNPSPHWLEGISVHSRSRTQATGPLSRFDETFTQEVISLAGLLHELKPDIVHGHYVTNWCWWGAFTGCQPFVVTTWGSDVFLDTANAFNRRLTQFTLGEAAAVTADSMDLMETTIRLRGGKDHVHLVPFGIDVDFFRPGYDLSSFKARLGVDGKKVVLSPRQFRPESNIDVIIKAIPRVLSNEPETIFILKNYLSISQNDREYEQRIRRLVHELNVQDHVLFLSDIPFEDMPLLYNMSRVVLSLRDTDGSACSVLESMACMTPVVASDIESMREWITDGKNGRLVDQHDPDEVAEAILDLLADDAKRLEYAGVGHRLVTEKADFRKNWIETERLYYESIERKHMGGRTAPVDFFPVPSIIREGWDCIGQGRLSEARKRLLRALEGENLTAYACLKALTGLGRMEASSGDHQSARAYFVGCLAVLRGYELDQILPSGGAAS